MSKSWVFGAAALLTLTAAAACRERSFSERIGGEQVSAEDLTAAAREVIESFEDVESVSSPEELLLEIRTTSIGCACAPKRAISHQPRCWG